MKFIGQHIVDLIARFRSDVYLEDVSSGTIASGANLGLDSNNKLVKASVSGGTDTNTTYSVSCVDGDNSDEEKIRLTDSSGGTDDIVLEAGTGLSIARSSDKITFTNTVSDTNTMGSGFTVSATTDSNATTITQGDDLFFAAGTGITCETTADGTVTITNTVSDTNTNQLTEFTLTGDSGSNQTIAHGNTLDIAGGTGINTVVGATDTVTVTAVPGEIDHDSLQNFDANEHFTQANITTVGTIGNGTWQGTPIATDQQKHLVHFRFMGYSTGDGTNYEAPQPLTDGQAPFEHADTSSADGLSISSSNSTSNVSEFLRMGGHLMVRAGTLKKWKGWTSVNENDAAAAYIALFKWSPVENDNTDISASHGGLTKLVEATVEGRTNDKVFALEETSFSATVSAGDIIFTQVKTKTSGKNVYFNTTLEVEM